MSDELETTNLRAAGVPPGFRFAVGERLANRYVVLRPIARGGMGEVYEVEDTELNEHIALKTLDAKLADDPTTLARFRAEVKNARHITHPNVCRMFDLGTHLDARGEVMFLTMELLSGEALDQRARRARLSRSEFSEIITQVCAGLDAAHASGVVHRDLKPSNVMLVPASEGRTRAVVTDFGIARSLDQSTLTKDGWVGTPVYIAPEQLEGQPAGPAADVYALGVMAFELVTGEIPFKGTSGLEVAMQRLTRAPPRARSVDATVPPSWDDAIDVCLSRLPGNRWARASDFAAALSSRAPTGGGRALRKRRRLVTAVLAAVLATGGLVYALGGLPSHDRVLAVRVVRSAGTPAVELPATLPPFEDAVAYVFRRQWQRAEQQRRFRVSADERGNVEALVRWKRDPEGVAVTVELESGGRAVGRVEARAASFTAAAESVFPEVSAVLAEGQPSHALWPEEQEQARASGAPSEEAYRELADLADRYYEAHTVPFEALRPRIEALATAHPNWPQAQAIAMSADIGARRRLDELLAREGGDLAPVIKQILAASRAPTRARLPEGADLIASAALFIAISGRFDHADEIAARTREIATRFPHHQFGAEFVAGALVDGRIADAEAELAAWARRAPGQRQVWVGLLSGAFTTSPQLSSAFELLFSDVEAQLMLAAASAASADTSETESRALKLLGTSMLRNRALAQYLLAVTDLERGHLHAAETRLARAWELAEQALGLDTPEFIWTQVAEEGIRVCETLGKQAEATAWRLRYRDMMRRLGNTSVLLVAAEYEHAHATTGACPPSLEETIEAADRAEARKILARVGARLGCVPCSRVVELGPTAHDSSIIPWTTTLARCAIQEGKPEVGLAALPAPRRTITLSMITTTPQAPVTDQLLARYWRGRLLAAKGDTKAARTAYELFLEAWNGADFASPEVEFAKKALAEAP